jgi:hypothetical protein
LLLIQKLKNICVFLSHVKKYTQKRNINMRRVPRNTCTLFTRTHSRPISILRLHYSSTPAPQKEQPQPQSQSQQATKSNLWTFLWGAKDKKENTTKPSPLQDILSYRVKASEVSPFEYVFVNSVEKLEGVVSHLKQHKLLSVDCEGVDHSREGTLCLLQIATEKDVFLIDVVALGKTAFTTGMFCST